MSASTGAPMALARSEGSIDATNGTAEATVATGEEGADEIGADEEQFRSRRAEVSALKKPQVIDRVVIVYAGTSANDRATIAAHVPGETESRLFVSFGLGAVPLPKTAAMIAGWP